MVSVTWDGLIKGLERGLASDGGFSAVAFNGNFLNGEGNGS